MTKKLLLFPLIVFAVCLGMVSCVDDDDDVNIDEEWKSLNEGYYNKVAADASYNALSSQSGNGKVYWKNSSVIVDSKDALRISPEGKPEFTDTVVVRYEGWYLDKEGEKVIFDSTENPSVSSRLAYALTDRDSPYPNKKSIKFAVNGVIDGWTTLLQDMKVGEEREVCIPQILAYGSIGSTYYSSTTKSTYPMTPGYTTLWFNVRLLKIIPMKGQK